MKLLGLEIANKTDILAFTAFVLSLISVVYQVGNFLLGPEIILADPRQVVLYFTPTPDADERHLTFISALAYVNRGNAGNNGVVMEERIGFSMNGKDYIFTWHGFVLMTSQPMLIASNESDKRRIRIKEIKTAGPFVIPGSGAEAHETRFAARFENDFINEKMVLDYFKEVLQGKKESKWLISFYAETLNDGSKSAICEITMTARYVGQLLDRDQGWAVINCNRDRNLKRLR